MKPTTPEQFAACYGTFIADLVIAIKVVPAFNTWLQSTIPTLASVYKLNSTLFTSYTATITSFPSKPSSPYNESRSDAYNKRLQLAFTAISIDLRSALNCAEVDPTTIAKIVASFLALERGLQTRVR